MNDKKNEEVKMVKSNVFDVAKYILSKTGEITAMKLQKLVYYCQAWSLVWDEKPIFNETIEAWAGGPVVKKLYDEHKGGFVISDLKKGNINQLTKIQKETVDSVLEFYGKKSGQWLSDLTHSEDPWIEARNGLSPGVRSNNEINIASMHEYYSSL